jgi:serine phosphatase RsbU (regulator of sigma subunit)/anti-sigma regulatory factor (Ser/Thr protein kinase)
MTTLLQYFRRATRRRKRTDVPTAPQPIAEPMPAVPAPGIAIAPNDPLIAYFLSVPSAVELDRLRLDSPALEAMHAAGIKVVVPLVSQGELIGIISLGPRRSQQEYSSDDRGLLSNLAVQAAPAVRVAQLVYQQQAEALQRERIAQELRVAHLVQQTLLPRAIPNLPGWQIDRYYQPAREVGGDFYDFIDLPNGRLGLVIGDVTDKGVPAALVMATTRSVLRAVASQLESPGAVLGRVNDVLVNEIPPNMFVTCLYAILDPQSGQLRFANAGHDLPYRHYQGGTDELRARGMPLGLMPDMVYEENELIIAPGEGVLFYSDGIVEAHNADREMFSFGRLQRLLAHAVPKGGEALVQVLLAELARFTGEGWDQEDDITMVLLERVIGDGGQETGDRRQETGDGGQDAKIHQVLVKDTLNSDISSITSKPTLDLAQQIAFTIQLPPPNPQLSAPDTWRTLAEWALPSEPGNEHIAMERVGEACGGLVISPRRLERLKTAVAEATMNAIEHGNRSRPELMVELRVRASADAVAVEIIDQGGATPIGETEEPDLYAKLEGEQSPRGWGLFLIKSMVDDMRVSNDEQHHRIELIMQLENTEQGANNASESV